MTAFHSKFDNTGTYSRKQKIFYIQMILPITLYIHRPLKSCFVNSAVVAKYKKSQLQSTLTWKRENKY